MTIRCEQAGESLRVEVKDTGAGIDASDQERLFQAFSQLDSGLDHAGTGLGLSIAKTIVERMGGRIGVTSTVNQGSLFWFEVPLEVAPPDTGEEGAALEPSPPHTAGARILLVEDNPINRRVLSLLLCKLGYAVDSVGDGLGAVEASQLDYDVILMDCRLPDIDGREATRRVRARGCRSRIVALTANASRQDRAHCLEAGMDDYLSKPVSAQRLERVLRRWTAGSGAATS